jgi:hypothetical protein
MARSPKNKKLSAGDIATWTRERSSDEIQNFLGRRMNALSVEYAEVEDDEQVGLYDLVTV